MSTAILWLRQDLRLSDNPALIASCEAFSKLLIVFIDDPVRTKVLAPGAASKVWLHNSLLSLQQSLERAGQTLVCLQGDSEEILLKLVNSTGAIDRSFSRWGCGLRGRKLHFDR